jgi:hypothetical protein
MAESLLDALEGSLRIFEKHRIFLLSCGVNRPSKGDHPSAPTRRIPIGAPWLANVSGTELTVAG